MKNIQFELMKPGEIIEEKKLLPLVFLPVGPLEWHGPHLPLGTDPLIAYEVSLRIARDIGGVVLPPFYWGTERERDANTLKNLGFQGNEWVVGMDFPNNSMKSLYIQEDFFALGIRIILEKLVEQGYLFIVIINGHGATNQIFTLERLAKEFQNERNVNIIIEFVAVPDENGVIDYGHAVASETSKLMAIHPDSVDLGKLPSKDKKYKYRDWAIVDGEAFLGQPDPKFEIQEKNDPRFAANPETGEILLQRAVKTITEKIKQRLEK
jgi:creatinine amidohydrolase